MNNEEQIEELQKEKQFILEVLKRITPDTSWHGETYSDDKSIDNIDTLEDMIFFLLDELFIDSTVPAGNKGNYSYEAIARKKQKIISFVKEEYFDIKEEREKITLKEFWNSEENLAIHCKTKEQADNLCKAFDRLGKKWKNGASYALDNCFSCIDETCYCNNRTWCDKSNLIDLGWKVYDFEDVIIEEDDK